MAPGNKRCGSLICPLNQFKFPLRPIHLHGVRNIQFSIKLKVLSLEVLFSGPLRTFPCLHYYVVKGKTCRQAKDAKGHLQPTIYVYKKDKLMPKLCMTRTINLSNTQFRYQLVFFIHINGYIWSAEGCLWHLFPRQNMHGGMFCLAA